MRPDKPPEKQERPNPEPIDYEKAEWQGYADTEAEENDVTTVPNPGPIPIQGKFNHPMGTPEMDIDIGRNLAPNLDDIDKEAD